MNRHKAVGLALAVSVAMLGGLPVVLQAQDGPVQAVRTLVIKDNQVLIDGRQVDSSELPKGLRLDSISVSYSFVGIDEPVVNLSNYFFAVRPNRLELIPVDHQFGNRRSAQKKSDYYDFSDAKGWIVDQQKGEYYSFQGERLEANEAVPKLLGEANNLYLHGLQYRNQALFSRLSREQELENEAARLANQVRFAKNESERLSRTSQLTAKLTEIFEFKQQNRRAEIAQFERELDTLRERLERREAQKDRLIKHRVDLLTKQKEQDQP